MALPFRRETFDYIKNVLGITGEPDPDAMLAGMLTQHANSGQSYANFEPTGEDFGWRYDAETTLPRMLVNSNAVALSASQSLQLVYFRAARTELVTNVITATGGTAAGATPTLCRVGIYSVNDSTGDLGALLASTPNDTTLWAGTATNYTKALSVQWQKTAGIRYAVGLLCVTGAALPSFVGASAGSNSGNFRAEMAALGGPRLTASVASQADLPASLTNAQVIAAGAQSGAIYVRFS